MVVVFDLNGTLLDSRSLAPQFRRIFGERYSAREWFNQVVQYSMATTLSGRFQEFGDVAIAVLKMAAAAEGVRLSSGSVQEIREAMQSLPPFPEVKAALARLHSAGHRLVVLTNSSSSALKRQLRNAELADFFERAISIDEVGKSKPAPQVYEAAARMLGLRTGELWMTAAHPWDLLGAASAGCRTALLLRPGSAVLPGVPAPDLIAADLDDFASRITEIQNSAPNSFKGSRPQLLTLAGLATASIAANVFFQRRRQRRAAPKGDSHLSTSSPSVRT
jgi:2-haloacid dehalogenase